MTHRLVHNLVVEDAEVERQPEANGVRGREVLVRNVQRVLVRSERVLARGAARLAGLELGQVPVVVTLHLHVEDAAVAVRGGTDQHVVQQRQDLLADGIELLLDLGNNKTGRKISLPICDSTWKT